MVWTHGKNERRAIAEKKQEGCIARGRPQLRWEDCLKRDLRKAEEEEKWSEKANNREQWKNYNKSRRTAMCQLTSLTPTKWKREEEHIIK